MPLMTKERSSLLAFVGGLIGTTKGLSDDEIKSTMAVGTVGTVGFSFLLLEIL